MSATAQLTPSEEVVYSDLRYISIVNKGAYDEYFLVRPPNSPHKTFSSSAYGGSESAYRASREYRDSLNGNDRPNSRFLADSIRPYEFSEEFVSAAIDLRSLGEIRVKTFFLLNLFSQHYLSASDLESLLLIKNGAARGAIRNLILKGWIEHDLSGGSWPKYYSLSADGLALLNQFKGIVSRLGGSFDIGKYRASEAYQSMYASGIDLYCAGLAVLQCINCGARGERDISRLTYPQEKQPKFTSSISASLSKMEKKGVLIRDRKKYCSDYEVTQIGESVLGCFGFHIV